MPTSQIKGHNLGEDSEQSARIADASVQRDGASPSYETWSKDELTARAREIGLQGRTLMTKAQLIKALRNR